MMNYNTKTFNQVFENLETFKEEYVTSGLYDGINIIKDESINVLYYLLYAKYGNTPIANYDVNQFKYKMWSIIFQYGPTWEKELQIQNRLQEINLDNDEWLEGATSIYNHAYNPGSEPSTQSLNELTYINDQNVTKTKKSKLNAYNELMVLLKTNVTNIFINQFAVCFKKFVGYENPIIYTTNINVEENE